MAFFCLEKEKSSADKLPSNSPILDKFTVIDFITVDEVIIDLNTAKINGYPCGRETASK